MTPHLVPSVHLNSTHSYVFYISPTLFFKIFIYLLWLLQVLVGARGLLVAACMWDLVPGPGIEPVPPALGAQSLTHWTTREVPPRLFMSLSPILHLFEAHFRGQWFPNCTPQHPRTLAAPAGHHERARISWGDAAKLSLCPRSCTTALS